MAVTSPDRIERLILNHLALHEMRLLALLVAVRKSLAGPLPYKGDLGEAVSGALRRLIAGHSVVDTGGVFSLCPQTETQSS